MRASRTVVLSLSVLAFGCLAAGVVSGEERAPGRYKRIACEGDASLTYDLLIPAAYAAEPERKLPVLFLSSPGGNPGFIRMGDWAERRGVILVAINDTKNNIGLAKWDEIQADVIKSVESTLRLHPCLRFSMGLSGAAMASMRLANRYSDKHAGILMLAHSGNGEDRGLAKHIAVAFVHAENDKVHGADAVRSVARSLERRGNPVRQVCGEWGHSNGPHEHHVRFLDWMLDLQRLVHPNLPPEERKAAADEIARRVKALGGTADAAARLKEAEALLGFPESVTRRHSKELHAGWFSAAFELGDAETDVVAKHAALTALSENERLAGCPPAERRKLSKLLAELRRKSPAKEEWAAHKLHRQVAFMEEKAGKSRSKKMKAAQAYAMIAKKYADTVAGRKAAEAAKRLAADLSGGR
ncbi:MAG: alpha/beta hydrolase family protein [Planctomycetota bacterium]|jgi:hypothetical protein